MTDSEIEKVPFHAGAVLTWAKQDSRRRNWPVVYTIFNDTHIYVGETTNAELRMRQHLVNPDKSALKNVNVIIHADFNKSACLDLESYLIKYFAADDRYIVMNGNSGISESDYYQRDQYRKSFDEIFEKLRVEGAFTRSIPDIVNSDLFKYSPFKSLNTDQAIAIDGILEQLFDELREDSGEPVVVQGEPGTGKTIVAVYLMKLLADIKNSNVDDARDVDSLFADFFQIGFQEMTKNLKFALVVPQLSLRNSMKKVFARTPGLSKDMVLSTFELGNYEKDSFDLLIVDETHRLQQRANQSSGPNNRKYIDTNLKFFGIDDKQKTQLDWVKHVSKNQILLLDREQTVKPADLPKQMIDDLVRESQNAHTWFRLTSQMRVAGGDDYIEYVTKIFSNDPPKARKEFSAYEFKYFESFTEMKGEILKRENEVRLSRLLAGYAWPWVSKNGATEFDFVIEGVPCIWNRTDIDWINSPTSRDEIGSIHTVQGYDLNFAGVIIGPELSYDPINKKLIFIRENYHDKKGKENNPTLGKSYTDDELLSYVCNIYRVLLTRGIKGTFVYAVDANLAKYLEGFFA